MLETRHSNLVWQWLLQGQTLWWNSYTCDILFTYWRSKFKGHSPYSPSGLCRQCSVCVCVPKQESTPLHRISPVTMQSKGGEATADILWQHSLVVWFPNMEGEGLGDWSCVVTSGKDKGWVVPNLNNSNFMSNCFLMSWTTNGTDAALLTF